MSKKNMALKIVIPVLFLCTIIAIWIAKNSKQDSNFKDDGNPDFTLYVTEEIDIDKLKSYELPIIIDFGADSCVPCKEMAPVLKEMNEELRGKAIIKFVDVWKYQDLAKDYPISIIPTQIFINSDGKPYNPKDIEGMQMILYSSRETGEHIFTTHEGAMTKSQLLDVLEEME